MLDSFHIYLQQLRTTNIQNIHDPQHTFPAVTFCNLNTFNSSDEETKKFIESIISENGFTSPLNASGNMTAHSTMSLILELSKSALAYKLSLGNISLEYIKSLGMFFDRMLVSCTFVGKSCSSDDFKYSYSFQYGNCFTFNAAPENREDTLTAFTGPKNALKLELFTGDPRKHCKIVFNRDTFNSEFRLFFKINRIYIVL